MFFNRVWETLLWGSGEKRELFLCSLCEVCVCVLSFGGGCCFSVLPRVFLILRSRLGKNKSQATQWIKTNKQQQQQKTLLTISTETIWNLFWKLPLLRIQREQNHPQREITKEHGEPPWCLLVGGSLFHSGG